jgi:lipoyl synthase
MVVCPLLLLLLLEAAAMGFSNAACAPLVRSSYHADLQAHEAGVA